jgi:molybdopterin biosynthesis enzyme MoaB
VLSRGISGISKPTASGHRSVIVNLPGSTGGARDGVQYLTPILPHLIDQLRGGDH